MNYEMGSSSPSGIPLCGNSPKRRVIPWGEHLLTGSSESPLTGSIIIIIFILFILASFISLKVTINENYLQIKFGYGIFSKRFRLNEIDTVKTVKNHWYYGWGIRLWLWPRMLIFNISGFDAVELTMKNNKIYRIGTDEPEKLKQTILQSIKQKTF